MSQMKEKLKLNTLAIILFTLIQIISGNERPNIVILVADDLGWDDIGFHSNQLRTPNIDTLAADGVVLDNYYTSPVCSPSRGALMSSVHPIHSGLQNYVILTASPWGLPLDLKILPQYLKDYNYKTHAIGLTNFIDSLKYNFYLFFQFIIIGIYFRLKIFIMRLLEKLFFQIYI